MKKYLPVFFFLFQLETIPAQVVFCPPGAEWNYLFNAFNLSSNPKFINERIKYVRDSVIGVDTVKVLSHKLFFNFVNPANSGPTLIKQKGDTIWMRNIRTQHTWQVLYNFAAMAGQSWTVSFVPNTTFTTIVNSASDTVVNGYTLKTLKVTWTTSNWGTNSLQIIERLGTSEFLFFYPSFMETDGDIFAERLCYKDEEFGLLKYTPNDCSYSYTVSLGENIPGKQLKLMPNPVTDYLMIESREQLETEFSDLMGNKIFFPGLILENNEARIDLTALPIGFYFLKVFYSGQLSGVYKIIKE
jgi:hypothetical protein